jgi:AICAR transformylase/IMP cyclohydrolase PurH
MTDTKEEFLKSFNKEKYLTETKELAEAMIDLVSGYTIAQTLTAFEAAVFFIASIGDDKEIRDRRIKTLCTHLRDGCSNIEEKKNVD